MKRVRTFYPERDAHRRTKRALRIAVAALRAVSIGGSMSHGQAEITLRRIAAERRGRR